MEAEIEDATGEIDTSELEEDLDEEDEGEDEENNSLIGKLAAKLPFLANILNKKKDEDDDDDDEEKEVTKTQVGSKDGTLAEGLAEPEWMIKIKEKAPFLEGPLAKVNELMNKKKSSGDDDEEEDEYGEGKPKKKQLKVIHVVIILAICGAILFGEEDGGEDPAQKKTAQSKKTAPKKKSPKATDKTTTQTKKPEVKNTEPKKVVEKKEEVPKTETAKAETKPVKQTTDDEFDLGADLSMDDTDSATETKTEKKANSELDDLFGEEEKKPTVKKPEPKKVVEKEPELDLGLEPEPEPKAEPKKVVKEDVLAADTTTSDMVGEINTGNDSMKNDMTMGLGAEDDPLNLSGAIEDELLTTNNDNSAITDDILKKLEVKTKALKNAELLEKATSPTDPPDYINPGSALVYNCAGGHWACVDAKDYQVCESNYAWNLKQGISIQCYPTEVYEKEEDCIALQQYRIDSIAKTDFCQ